MSRRFGRNKRRQLREQIAQKDRTIGYWLGSATEARSEHRDLKRQVASWAARIIEALPSESPFHLELAEMRISEYIVRDRRFRVDAPQPSAEIVEEAILRTPDRNAVELFEVFCHFVECYRDDLSQHFVARLHTPTGAVGFGVDEKTLIGRKVDAALVEYVADRVAHGLVRIYKRGDHLGPYRGGGR